MQSASTFIHKKNIAFIGMMGCGKTSVAKELSKFLTDFIYVDIDEEIEKISGKKISEIFRQHGEEYFRMIECETIKKIFQGEKLIIALGGGAFENPQTEQLSRSRHILFI